MGEERNSPKTDEDDDLTYLFTVETNPTHVQDDLDVPVYSSKFEVLKEKAEVEDTEKPKASKPVGVTCWNCNGSHNLRDCKEKRNFALINQRRAANQSRFTKVRRYHADEEQKYAHLRPGQISQALRSALGLRPEQVPHHVYKMRQLGYPPGWVEEAKICHSGLSMFDSQGQETKDPELEDGEIVNKQDKDKYDTRKLIEYPGFNVPFEPGTIDETEKYGACPMRETQSVKHMLQLWSGKKVGSYRRKRLKIQSSTSMDSPSVPSEAISLHEEDMELDAEVEAGEVKLLPPTDNCGFIPPLPDNSPMKPPPPPSTPGKSPTETPEAGKGEKRKLSEDEDEEVPPSKDESSTNESLENSQSSVTQDESLDGKNITSPSPAAAFNGRVKSVSSGTPVITRSEFKHLPAPEKFSKDICDVINFENLPDSTGKYEQMRGLVQKVRDYVSLSFKSDESGDSDSNSS